MTMTPYTLGGANNAPGTGTTLQFTLTHAVAAGDAIVIAAASDGAAETVTGVTDSQSNTWVNVTSDYNQPVGLSVWAVLGANAMTTSDTITATFSASAGSHTITGRGCNGIGTAVAIDVAITNDNAGSTSPSSGASGTLRQSSEWAVAFLASGNAGGTPASWTGGFTAIASQHHSGDQYLTAADQTVAATSALTAGATITSAAWAMALLTFRAAPYLAGANSFGSGSTSTVVTVGAAAGSQGVASGDLVLVVCGVGSSSTAPSSVTDSSSQTYTLVASEKPGSGLSSYVYAAYNSAALTSGVATVTVTWNSTSNNKLVTVVGCNGITTSAAFDQSAGNSGTSAAPSSGATPPLMAAGEPSAGVLIGGSASVSTTPSTGWVQLGSTLHVSGGVYMAVAQQSAASSSGVTASGTLGTSAAWSALAAAFTQTNGGDFNSGFSGVTSLSVTSPDPITAGTVGVPYSYQLAATGGVTPYTWAISSGSLPAGLTLTSGGGAADFTYIGAAAGPQGAPTIAGWNLATYGNTGGTGTYGAGLLGPLSCAKVFYSNGGGPGALYTGQLGGDANGGGTTGFTSGLEGAITSSHPGVFVYVCWATVMSATAINNYVSNIPHNVTEVGFSYQSEPENAYAVSAAGGAQFVKDWTDQANKIRAAQALTPVKLTLILSSYQGHYGAADSQLIVNGSPVAWFIPPASVVDVYGLDAYDRKNYWGSSSSIGTTTFWTNWLKLVKGLGKPLAVTEYGISGAASAAEQNSRLQADWNYFKTAFGSGGSVSQSPLYCWLAWDTGSTSTPGAGYYTNSPSPPNNKNQFMSAAVEATWKGIVQTASNQPGTSSGTGGLISGTPTTAVSAQAFTARVTDTLSATATKATHLTIAAASALAENDTDPLAGGTINVPYSVTLSASGGTSPYTFSVNSGSLPTGLSISGNTITGTPTVAATSTFVIKVTDNVSATALSPTLHITIATGLAITTTSLSPAQLGSFYTFTLSASGGAGGNTWAVDATSPSLLPSGLALDPATGIISGTPAVSGSFPLAFNVTDSAGATAVSGVLTLAIATSTGLPAIGRQVYGGAASDFVFLTSGSNIQIDPGATITFWNAKTGGAQYTDLQDMSNSPITQVTADSLGFPPQFQGPAGLTSGMWADAHGGSGPRYLIRPDLGALLVVHQTYLKMLTG